MKAMTNNYDILIVGGGHNGLICAAYLARAGKRVCVLEARGSFGGAAATEAITDKCRASTGAQFLYQLHPQIIADLALEKHGLRYARRNLPTTVLATDGKHLTINHDRLTGENVSAEDQQAFSEFIDEMQAFAKIIGKLIDQPPMDIFDLDWDDKINSVKLGWALRFGLGKTRMRELLRIIGMTMFDLADEKFDNDLLKGALSFDSVLGTQFGARSSGNVLKYLFRHALSNKSEMDLPYGGMGSVVNAIEKSAAEAGVELRSNAKVKSIDVENCRVVGVTLENGEKLIAGTVISNTDIRTTVLDLVGSRHFEADFVHATTNVRMRGVAAKLHLVLSAAPEFNGLDQELMKGRLLIAPSAEEVELAYNAVKYGELSERPLMEISIPSLCDDTVFDGDGDGDCHLLNATVQYAPYALKGGWNDENRAELIERCITQLERYSPDIRGKIQHVDLLTPLDLEKRFGLKAGDWDHGEMALDQMLILRPVPGSSRYNLPLDGLHLCGASAHPGGGVMGAAGRNAARMILKGEAK